MIGEKTTPSGIVMRLAAVVTVLLAISAALLAAWWALAPTLASPHLSPTRWLPTA